MTIPWACASPNLLNCEKMSQLIVLSRPEGEFYFILLVTDWRLSWTIKWLSFNSYYAPPQSKCRVSWRPNLRTEYWKDVPTTMTRNRLKWGLGFISQIFLCLSLCSGRYYWENRGVFIFRKARPALKGFVEVSSDRNCHLIICLK